MIASPILESQHHQNQSKQLHSQHRPNFILKAGSYDISLGQKTSLMGIINVTPDSFSADGCLAATQDPTRKAYHKAKKFIKEGANIIDVGGESSRPGASSILVKEELDRVIPVIALLAQKCQVPISIDSYKPTVVQQALDAGATIVNNIMGTQLNKSLLKMVRNYKAAIVLMHMKGKPRTMQKKITYVNLIDDIMHSLKNALEQCLDAGIDPDRMVIDPGIGFGKTVEHNLELIQRLSEFQSLNTPILMGTSRKSFIGHILNTKINDRLEGTIATVCASILNGAHIVRIHDVKQIRKAVAVTDAILNSTSTSINQ